MKSAKTLCLVTSTRADYGILRPLVRRLHEAEDIELRIVATGTHLCPEFGGTVREIEADGFPIHWKPAIQLSSDSAAAMSKTMGMALLAFAEYFQAHTPDLLVVLGDRYEIEAVCCAAINQRIPIAHLCGGEVTTGAVDNSYRHAITKMSSLHFPTTDVYRRRIIQMGEAPETVFNFGSMSIENSMRVRKLPLDELSADLGFPLRENGYAVVTFHPVTLENHSESRQLEELFAAMEQFGDLDFVITKANADAGGRAVNALWEEFAAGRGNCLLVDSLGAVRYLSALKHACMMLGNSSSGITEGPASGIPTVNMGDRQRGRLMGESILCCRPERGDIARAMRRALEPGFRESCRSAANPYGDGRTSENIFAVLRDFLWNGKLTLQKDFFDYEI